MAARFGFDTVISEGMLSLSWTPRQTLARQADVPVAGSPSSHRALSSLGAFAGQTAVAPSQTASASQAASAARHTVPAGTSRQLALQHEPGAPFAAPASHCSPSAAFTLPSPQA